jgi:uncharacterized protein with FMN-binding domain
MKKNLTKYIVGAIIVVAFVAYLIFTNENSQVVTTVTTTNPSPITSGIITTTTSTTGGTTTTAGEYKDGTYTGPVSDAFYGKLQVAAVVQGGKLTDVQFLQYPNDNRESARIAQQAMTVLKQEAVTAQSAQVNIVSGATQDSQAFQQSLSAALAEAK